MPIYYIMGLVLSLMICTGLMLELVVPAVTRARQLGKKREQERFYLTKLRIVRRYYPTLSELTYSEIVEQYDVEALYENLGRSGFATAR